MIDSTTNNNNFHEITKNVTLPKSVPNANNKLSPLPINLKNETKSAIISQPLSSTFNNVCAYAKIIGYGVNYYIQSTEIYCGRRCLTDDKSNRFNCDFNNNGFIELDLHLGDCDSISELQFRISYCSSSKHFNVVSFSPNGILINNMLYEAGVTEVLYSQDIIEIPCSKHFKHSYHFLLPRDSPDNERKPIISKQANGHHKTGYEQTFDERERFKNAFLSFGYHRPVLIKKSANLSRHSISEVELFSQQILIELSKYTKGDACVFLKKIIFAEGLSELCGKIDSKILYWSELQIKAMFQSKIIRNLYLLSEIMIRERIKGTDILSGFSKKIKNDVKPCDEQTTEDDKQLMRGTYKFGLGNYDAMKSDLNFSDSNLRKFLFKSEENESSNANTVKICNQEDSKELIQNENKNLNSKDRMNKYILPNEILLNERLAQLLDCGAKVINISTLSSHPPQRRAAIQAVKLQEIMSNSFKYKTDKSIKKLQQTTLDNINDGIDEKSNKITNIEKSFKENSKINISTKNCLKGFFTQKENNKEDEHLTKNNLDTNISEIKKRKNFNNGSDSSINDISNSENSSTSDSEEYQEFDFNKLPNSCNKKRKKNGDEIILPSIFKKSFSKEREDEDSLRDSNMDTDSKGSNQTKRSKSDFQRVLMQFGLPNIEDDDRPDQDFVREKSGIENISNREFQEYYDEILYFSDVLIKGDTNIDAEVPMSNSNRSSLSASNPYAIFCKENRQQMRDDYPHLDFGSVNAKLGEWQRSLSDKEREPYESRALSHKNKFLASIEANFASDGLTSSKSSVDITLPFARKIVLRLQLMDNLRYKIIQHPNILLKNAPNADYMPNQQKIGHHDVVFLNAVLKHGIGQQDAMFNDTTIPQPQNQRPNYKSNESKTEYPKPSSQHCTKRLKRVVAFAMRAIKKISN